MLATYAILVLTGNTDTDYEYINRKKQELPSES